MKRILPAIFAFLLILGGFGSLQAQSNRVPWQEDSPLTWNNFTRIPDNGRGYAASVYWEMSYNMEWVVDEPVFKVEVFAVKSKSWVKKGLETPKLLAHERLHFDIAEIYARKLRKEFANWKPGDKSPDSLFNAIMKECNAYQDLYDSETDHGTRPEQQAFWAKKVPQELKALSAWRQR
ncbi:MAG: hypothetical protein H6581_28905 [Bacteroidia bacterium]|nr:hypothetical protein [Bacteroidia bacterium]